MINAKTLVAEYRKKLGKLTYEQEDCITSISEIILRYGGKHNLNGSNWYARNEIKNLRPLTSKGQLYDGCAVLKTVLPGEAGYDLPSRYANHLDQIDYNHIGLGTSDGDILDSTRTSDGRDGPGVSTAPINSRSWDLIGDFEDVDYSDAGQLESNPGDIHIEDLYLVTAPSGDTVNLRAKQNVSSVVYEYVKIGSAVSVMSKNATWSKVRTASGKIGWMMNKFLSKIDASEVEHSSSDDYFPQSDLTLEDKVDILWMRYISD